MALYDPPEQRPEREEDETPHQMLQRNLLNAEAHLKERLGTLGSIFDPAHMLRTTLAQQAAPVIEHYSKLCPDCTKLVVAYTFAVGVAASVDELLLAFENSNTPFPIGGGEKLLEGLCEEMRQSFALFRARDAQEREKGQDNGTGN